MSGLFWTGLVGFAAMLAWGGCARSGASLAPRPDVRAQAMKMEPAAVPLRHEPHEVPHFSRPIPRHVHQIWFGSNKAWDRRKNRGERLRTQRWLDYAKTFGYGYTMWTDANVDAIAAMVGTELRPLFCTAHRTKQWRLASDLARLAILHARGGTYVDCDMLPPHDAQGELPLYAFLPEGGLVLTSERSHRAIGATGLFVANGFMLASPGHPILRHLLAHVPENVAHLRAAGYSLSDPIFAAGCMPLTRSLAGAFYLVPLDDLLSLGVFQEMKAHWLPAKVRQTPAEKRDASAGSAGPGAEVPWG